MVDSLFKRRVTSWFVVPKSIENPRYRIFCIPYAGGNAQAFHKWGAQFSQDEIFSLQLPGRAFRIREPCIRDCGEMVEAMMEQMEGHLDVPFVLYGHSMGGLLAFELARGLRRTNRPLPEGLFVTGRRAPQVLGAGPVAFDMPDDQFWRAVGKLYGTPKALLDSPDLKAMLLPTFRADFELLAKWRYCPEPPFDFPIWAVGGTQDPGISQEAIWAWKEQTNGSFKHWMIEGGHMFLQQKEATLLQYLFDALESL